jgi:hypothetical protein
VKTSIQARRQTRGTKREIFLLLLLLLPLLLLHHVPKVLEGR